MYVYNHNNYSCNLHNIISLSYLIAFVLSCDPCCTHTCIYNHNDFPSVIACSIMIIMGVGVFQLLSQSLVSHSAWSPPPSWDLMYGGPSPSSLF